MTAITTTLEAVPACADCARSENGPALELLSRLPVSVARDFPPLLFVPGGWHGAICWDERFMPWLAARGYECHAISLRGHGGSDGAEQMNRHRMADLCDDLCRAASSLREPPVIVAHSLGGHLAAHYMACHALGAAILLTPVPPNGLWSVTGRFLKREPLRFFVANLTWNGKALVDTPARAKGFLFSDDMPDADVARYFAQLGSESLRVLFDGLFRRTPPRPKGTPAVLVVGADRDRLIGPRDNRRTAAFFDGKLVELTGIAHDVMLDPAWEQTATRMLEFLADLDPAQLRARTALDGSPH